MKLTRTRHYISLLASLTLMAAGTVSCKGDAQYEQFLNDNFAKGKVSDELLRDSAPGAVALISCCLYYESELQKGIARGEKWVYTNSSKYAPQNSSFDHMVESGHWGVNCALPPSWAYVDMGIMEEGSRFWGDRAGGFAKLEKVKESIEKAATITSLDGEKKFCELFEEGSVKSGDVFLCKGHTFIYLGDNLFLAAGHDGKWHSDETAETEDARHAVFESWIMPRESCANNEWQPTWQISFKEDYMPQFYRNSKGELVTNPAFNQN